MEVVALWRYPVKSMQGERLDAVEVADPGLAGDRQWALVDVATGLALTARREPPLLFAAARLTGPDEVAIELPDGAATVTSGDPDADDRLSSWLGRRVELRRAGTDRATYEIAADFEDEDGSPWVHWRGPAGTFHDSTRARVSLLGAATVGDWDPRRFRANVLVAGDPAGAEDELVGGGVAIGSATFDAVAPIVRCVMTTRPQPGGIARQLDVLRSINADRAGQLGIGLLVTRSGTMRVGDGVTATAPAPTA